MTADFAAESIESGLSLSLDLFSAEKLGRHFGGEEAGMDRLGYGSNETEAHQIVLDAAASLGLEAYQDLAGNLYMVLPGQDRNKPAFLIGSHLDAVQKGGAYDGPAGVVSALSAVKMLRQAGLTPPHDVVVVVWRCEESPNFKQFGLGSGLATGIFDEKVLDRENLAGQKLRDVLPATYLGDGDKGKRFKLLIEYIKAKKGLFDPASIESALEIHIEQSPDLLQSGKSLGIVSAIRGNVRFPKIEFKGIAQHTGGGEMKDRRDAGLMYLQFASGVQAVAERLMKRGKDIVYSFPKLEQEPNNATTTPFRVRCGFEARSDDRRVLQKMGRAVMQALEDLEKTYPAPCCFQMDEINDTSPSMMDGCVRRALLDISGELGFSCMELKSGAGHDIMRLEALRIPTGLLFIRHSGVSHNPKEDLCAGDPFASESDYAKAVRVAAEMMLRDGSCDRPKDNSFVASLMDNHAVRLTV
jgi:N-carbamoyl-L-amino-acid hydrolase